MHIHVQNCWSFFTFASQPDVSTKYVLHGNVIVLLICLCNNTPAFIYNPHRCVVRIHSHKSFHVLVIIMLNLSWAAWLGCWTSPGTWLNVRGRFWQNHFFASLFVWQNTCNIILFMTNRKRVCVMINVLSGCSISLQTLMILKQSPFVSVLLMEYNSGLSNQILVISVIYLLMKV